MYKGRANDQSDSGGNENVNWVCLCLFGFHFNWEYIMVFAPRQDLNMHISEKCLSDNQTNTQKIRFNLLLFLFF